MRMGGRLYLKNDSFDMLCLSAHIDVPVGAPVGHASAVWRMRGS